jgi:hypothetical protein
VKARERGYDVAVGKFPFSANGKARIVGQATGFVKIVAEKKYDEVLGVHVIGPSATELIAEACAALKLEATSEELVRTIHAHPTLSETMERRRTRSRGTRSTSRRTAPVGLVRSPGQLRQGEGHAGTYPLISTVREADR